MTYKVVSAAVKWIKFVMRLHAITEISGKITLLTIINKYLLY